MSMLTSYTIRSTGSVRSLTSQSPPEELNLADVSPPPSSPPMASPIVRPPSFEYARSHRTGSRASVLTESRSPSPRPVTIRPVGSPAHPRPTSYHEQSPHGWLTGSPTIPRSRSRTPSPSPSPPAQYPGLFSPPNDSPMSHHRPRSSTLYHSPPGTPPTPNTNINGYQAVYRIDTPVDPPHESPHSQGSQRESIHSRNSQFQSESGIENGKAIDVPITRQESALSHYQRPPQTRHERYYLDDGNVTFLVQNTLFCVHRHFFLKHSTAFTDALEFPQLVGSSPSMPCRLVRVTVEEFECLLDYFYEWVGSILSVDDIPIGKWVLLLRAATSYSFTRPREIAMRIIQSKFSIIPLVDRIILAEQCGITEWLESSWEEFIRRNEPMSLEEGMRFGMETVIKVAAAREAQKLRRVSEAGEILADVMAIRARMVSPQPPAIRSRTASISMQSTQL